MTTAHLHLLVNHLPIIGFFLAIPLLGLAVLRRHERGPLIGALGVVVLSAAGGGIALATGEPAEELVEGLPGVQEAAIERHEERAEFATVLAALSAVGAVGVAWAARRGPTPLAPTLALTASVVVTAGAMAWTGQAGGLVRHTELAAGGPGGMATLDARVVGEEDDD